MDSYPDAERADRVPITHGFAAVTDRVEEIRSRMRLKGLLESFTQGGLADGSVGDQDTYILVDSDAERALLELGPLVEGAREDGTRRFYIGDILSIIMGQVLTPRGMVGVCDILEYMTGESPHSAQIPRFTQECAPWLQGQFGGLLRLYNEQLAYGDSPESDPTELLRRIAEEMGASMLAVDALDPSAHAVMDLATELELDYGTEVTGKVIPSIRSDHNE